LCFWEGSYNGQKKVPVLFVFEMPMLIFFLNCDTLQVPEGYPSGIKNQKNDTQRVPAGYHRYKKITVVVFTPGKSPWVGAFPK
jgi:hypothetical protein